MLENFLHRRRQLRSFVCFPPETILLYEFHNRTSIDNRLLIILCGITTFNHMKLDCCMTKCMCVLERTDSRKAFGLNDLIQDLLAPNFPFVSVFFMVEWADNDGLFVSGHSEPTDVSATRAREQLSENF